MTHGNKGIALGVDIGGPGSDLCTCWKIEDYRASLLWWTVHRELMETAGRLVRTIRNYEGNARILCIDDTGIGNGVSSRLLEVQRWSRSEQALLREDPLTACSIIRINFSGLPTSNTEMFYRVKDQMWWELREDVGVKKIIGLPPESEMRAAALPRGNNLITQLVTPIYEQDSRGRIRVWDKRDGEREKTKALPSKSPDLAHGLMLANHGYRMLRTDHSVRKPRTILEVRRDEFHEHVQNLMKVKREKDENTNPDWYEHV